MWPCRPAGSPSSCASQSSVTSSSSCERRRGAPEDPDLVEPGAEQLGEDARLRAGVREVGEEARALPVREPRQEDVVEVAEDVRERLRLLGRRRGQPRAQLAGLDLREHREVAQPLEVRRDPLDRGGAVLAEAHFSSFSDLGPGPRVQDLVLRQPRAPRLADPELDVARGPSSSGRRSRRRAGGRPRRRAARGRRGGRAGRAAS